MLGAVRPWWCRINILKATFLYDSIGFFILVDRGVERHSSNTFPLYSYSLLHCSSEGRGYSSLSVDQDLFPIRLHSRHCNAQSREPLVGDPTLGNGEFHVLHLHSYCWRLHHLCVLLLCGTVLASCIYRSLAAGSISFTVCLRCEPRDLS